MWAQDSIECTLTIYLCAVGLVCRSGATLAKVGADEHGIDVNEWFALRDFVLRITLAAEFGLVAVAIGCQLVAATLITAFFICKVIMLDDWTDMLIGTQAYGVFALMMWAYTLPLLTSAVATNTELARHRMYLSIKICKIRSDGDVSSVESNARVQKIQFIVDCLEVRATHFNWLSRTPRQNAANVVGLTRLLLMGLEQKYPTTLRIGGVPLTADIFLFVKGYLATAATTFIGKYALSDGGAQGS